MEQVRKKAWTGETGRRPNERTWGRLRKSVGIYLSGDAHGLNWARLCRKRTSDTVSQPPVPGGAVAAL